MASEPPTPDTLLDDVNQTLLSARANDSADSWLSPHYGHPEPPQAQHVACGNAARPIPFVEFVEQPLEEVRYRYRNEGSRAVLRGRRRETNPKIKIRNYCGAYAARVSLVTDDEPPKPHPHILTGKNCDHGVWEINAPDSGIFEPTFELKSVGLVAMRLQNGGAEIITSLQDRKNHDVDPYNTNDFSGQLSREQIHRVRICVEVGILQDGEQITLAPIVSDPILNQRHRQPVNELEAADPVDFRILRIVPANVIATYPSEICLWTTPLGEGNFHVFFSFDTASEAIPVQRRSIHGNSAVIVCPPRQELLTNQPIVANVLMSRQQPGLEAVYSSNAVQLTYEPSPYTTYTTILQRTDRQFNPLL